MKTTWQSPGHSEQKPNQLRYFLLKMGPVQISSSNSIEHQQSINYFVSDCGRAYSEDSLQLQLKIIGPRNIRANKETSGIE